MNRKESLRSFCTDFYGQKLVKKIAISDLYLLDLFIEENKNLGHLEFEYKVNRMFLDKQKPKNHSIIQEILISANTRALGK